jgi:hypothetical protein
MDKFIVKLHSASGAVTEIESNEAVKRKPKLVCRQYSYGYLFFSFTRFSDPRSLIPECSVCGKNLVILWFQVS